MMRGWPSSSTSTSDSTREKRVIRAIRCRPRPRTPRRRSRRARKPPRAPRRGSPSRFDLPGRRRGSRAAPRRRSPSAHAARAAARVDSRPYAGAAHEAKALLEPVERERVHPPVLNARAERSMNGSEALPALQLDAPTGSDPQPILLVVHRHDRLGPPALGEEGSGRRSSRQRPRSAGRSARVARRRGSDGRARRRSCRCPQHGSARTCEARRAPSRQSHDRTARPRSAAGQLAAAQPPERRTAPARHPAPTPSSPAIHLLSASSSWLRPGLSADVARHVLL